MTEYEEYENALDEIRESRRRMSEQCGNDPAKFIEYLKTFNEKYSIPVERYRKEHAATPTEITLVGN